MKFSWHIIIAKMNGFDHKNVLKWKEYLKILLNSEVLAKHQIAAVFSFSQNYDF